MDLPIYEIQSLRHSYAGKAVLSIDHMTIPQGSIVGLIGPNGSGKSSLLRLLGLIERPARGNVLFKGKRVEPFSDEARFAVSLLPQEPFLMRRSVLANVSYGLRLRGNGRGAAQGVRRALSLVGLPYEDFAHRAWYALSGGEAQRVAMAARLALKPEVLLLDEPTASVDVASEQLIKEASLRARRELGTTLVVASHDWQWLHEICDDIFHLFEGRIFGTGRETIIFGPWQELESGKWGKKLSKDQLLRVPAPPGRDAVAVIDDLSFSQEGTCPGQEDTVLEGTVSRLSLEKKTGHIFATVVVGGFPFTLKLTPQEGERHSIFPGKKIAVRYRIDRVTWVERIDRTRGGPRR